MNFIKKIICIFIIIFIIINVALIGIIYYKAHKKVYYAKDFGIETIFSKTDYDNDGIEMKKVCHT